jgi:ribosomal protein S27AE
MIKKGEISSHMEFSQEIYVCDKCGYTETKKTHFIDRVNIIDNTCSKCKEGKMVLISASESAQDIPNG